MQDRLIRLKPNVALHYVAQALLFLAPALMLICAAFGAWPLAAACAIATLLGRQPLVAVQNQNLLAQRTQLEMRFDDKEIFIDGARVLTTSEIREAFASPHADKLPTVTIYGKNKLIPLLEIEVANFEQANELLAAIGFGADQKAASFQTIPTKLAKWLPLFLVAPPLLLVAYLIRTHTPITHLMSQTMVSMAVPFLILRIAQRTVVRADGIETSILERFRKFYAFADIAKITRTLTGGSFTLISGETIPLRATVGAELTEGQRSGDALVERAIDAYDAYLLREPREAVAKVEANETLPERVMVLRTNWLGWLVPFGLFIGGFVAMLASSHQRGQLPLLWTGMAGIFAAMLAQIYLLFRPYRATREKVEAFEGALAFGKTKVDRSLLENAYVQPASATSGMSQRQFATSPRVVFTGKKWRNSFQILIDDESQGKALLHALSLDPARAVATFNVRAGLFANETVRFALVLVMALGAQLIRYTHGYERLALLLLLLLSFVNSFWPTKMKIGADGVFIKSLRSRQFYGFSEIERIEQSKNGVVLILDSKRRVEIRTSPTRNAVNTQRDAIVRRLQEGLAHARKSSGGVSFMLARGTLPTRAWIDRLHAIGKGEAEDYRVAAVEPADLWRVVEDPNMHEEERIAAAVALRVDPEAAARLRVAANVSASPRVRTALQAAADQDEELLERALEESTSDAVKNKT